jgi:TrmH family RNA methyltransferase
MNGISQITGRHNSRLAHIRKVRDGKIDGQIFIEGFRVAAEAMRSGVLILECAVTREMLDGNEVSQLVGELIGRGTQIFEVPKPLFTSLADTVNSQGVILIAERPKTGKEAVTLEKGREEPLVVFLERTNDPSNLGAVFRTAEAAGVSAVVVSTGSATVFSPKSIRAAMGSNLRVPTWDNAGLAECVGWAKEKGLAVRAADISGSKSLFEVDWSIPAMVVFGSEAAGLSQDELALTDDIFRIPMQNNVESLNLSVSAGIVLFEALRQRTSGNILTNRS